MLQNLFCGYILPLNFTGGDKLCLLMWLGSKPFIVLQGVVVNGRGEMFLVLALSQSFLFLALALWYRCAVAEKIPCSVYKNPLGLDSMSSRTQRRAAAARDASVYVYLPESIYIAELMS